MMTETTLGGLNCLPPCEERLNLFMSAKARADDAPYLREAMLCYRTPAIRNAIQKNANIDAKALIKGFSDKSRFEDLEAGCTLERLERILRAFYHGHDDPRRDGYGVVANYRALVGSFFDPDINKVEAALKNLIEAVLVKSKEAKKDAKTKELYGKQKAPSKSDMLNQGVSLRDRANEIINTESYHGRERTQDKASQAEARVDLNNKIRREAQAKLQELVGLRDLALQEAALEAAKPAPNAKKLLIRRTTAVILEAERLHIQQQLEDPSRNLEEIEYSERGKLMKIATIMNELPCNSLRDYVKGTSQRPGLLDRFKGTTLPKNDNQAPKQMGGS